MDVNRYTCDIHKIFVSDWLIGGYSTDDTIIIVRNKMKRYAAPQQFVFLILRYYISLWHLRVINLRPSVDTLNSNRE